MVEGAVSEHIWQQVCIFRAMRANLFITGKQVAFQCIAFSHHQPGRIDFNTVNTNHPTRKDFLIQSLGKD